MWKFQKNSPADLLNVPNRRILVTIFFSLASASCFLNKVTKMSCLKGRTTITSSKISVRRTKIFFQICDIKHSKFYKELKGSLTLLSLKNFSFFSDG